MSCAWTSIRGRGRRSTTPARSPSPPARSWPISMTGLPKPRATTASTSACASSPAGPSPRYGTPRYRVRPRGRAAPARSGRPPPGGRRSGEKVSSLDERHRDRTVVAAYSVRARPDATVFRPGDLGRSRRLRSAPTQRRRPMPQQYAELGDLHRTIDDRAFALDTLLDPVGGLRALPRARAARRSPPGSGRAPAAMAHGLVDQRQTLGDQLAGPTARGPDRPAARSRRPRRSAPRVRACCSSISASEAHDLRLGLEQAQQQARQADRLVAQRRAGRTVWPPNSPR